jgi:hypothetical protein
LLDLDVVDGLLAAVHDRSHSPFTPAREDLGHVIAPRRVRRFGLFTGVPAEADGPAGRGAFVGPAATPAAVTSGPGCVYGFVVDISTGLWFDNGMTSTRNLDTAALATASVVAQAMQVRSLTRSQAVALVAERTGMATEMVDALLDRATLVA